MIKIAVYDKYNHEFDHSAWDSLSPHELPALDAENGFWDKLRCWNLREEEEEEPPFRDELSRRFLKDAADIELVGGNDWYSIMQRGVRKNLSALENSIKSGLMIIDNSRFKRYTFPIIKGYLSDGKLMPKRHNPLECAGLDPRVWNILASYKEEFLIAVDKRDLAADNISVGANCVIVNFPGKEGTTYEAKVREDENDKNELFVFGSERKQQGLSVSIKDVNSAFKEETEKFSSGIFDDILPHGREIVGELLDERGKFITLYDCTKTYDLFEFAEKLTHDRLYFAPDSVKSIVRMEKYLAGKEDGKKFEDYLNMIEGTYDYYEYTHFKKMRVISHVNEFPQKLLCENPVLIESSKKLKIPAGLTANRTRELTIK